MTSPTTGVSFYTRIDNEDTHPVRGLATWGWHASNTKFIDMQSWKMEKGVLHMASTVKPGFNTSPLSLNEARTASTKYFHSTDPLTVNGWQSSTTLTSPGERSTVTTLPLMDPRKDEQYDKVHFGLTKDMLNPTKWFKPSDSGTS